MYESEYEYLKYDLAIIIDDVSYKSYVKFSACQRYHNLSTTMKLAEIRRDRSHQ